MHVLQFHSLDGPLPWMSWAVASFMPPLRPLGTILCKFYRCSNSMRNTALCMHCERWIPVALWLYYKMTGKWESSQPWLSESVVTQPWVKPQAGAYCWRLKLRLETSLRCIIARFANLGDLDEISQWQSIFCKL